MKTQRFLKINEDRPRWVVLADKIINRKITETCGHNENTLKDLFLQRTTVDTRATEKGLLAPIQKMLQVAKKHSVVFFPLALDNELKQQMSARLHLGLAHVKNIKLNTESMLCMRQAHKINTVGDMNALVRLLNVEAPSTHKKGRIVCAQHART